jgi:hypothetical protein
MARGSENHHSGEIVLSCLFAGEELNRVFSVGVDNDEAVGNLKEKIREKNLCTLQSIDARVLELWKVSLG